MCLVIFRNILLKSDNAANYIQSEDSRAVDGIKALKSDLTRETLFNEVWIAARNLIDGHNIPAPVERRRRSCKDDAHRTVWTESDYK